jgi:hypothetical protein
LIQDGDNAGYRSGVGVSRIRHMTLRCCAMNLVHNTGHIPGGHARAG